MLTVIEWVSGMNTEVKSGDLILVPALLLILCVPMDDSLPRSSVSRSIEWTCGVGLGGEAWCFKGRSFSALPMQDPYFSRSLKAFLLNLFIIVFEAPLGSVVSNHLSCQVGIMLGGLLASTGLILGSFATSLKHLYLTLGVLTGKGTLFHLSHPHPIQGLSSTTTEQ